MRRKKREREEKSNSKPQQREKKKHRSPSHRVCPRCDKFRKIDRSAMLFPSRYVPVFSRSFDAYSHSNAKLTNKVVSVINDTGKKRAYSPISVSLFLSPAPGLIIQAKGVVSRLVSPLSPYLGTTRVARRGGGGIDQRL